MAERKRLTHVDAKGAARMVDVGAKAVTERRAVARGLLRVSPETMALVRDGGTPKGDVLAAARLAGIMAAKKTSELIPLTHPLPITHATVELTLEREGIAIEATVATAAQTGVEMEALTAVSIAAPSSPTCASSRRPEESRGRSGRSDGARGHHHREHQGRGRRAHRRKRSGAA